MRNVRRKLKMKRPPFMGELMRCALCGKVERSRPDQSSNWRLIIPDGVRHYVCPDHFPADDATTEEFEIAYNRAFEVILGLPEGALNFDE